MNSLLSFCYSTAETIKDALSFTLSALSFQVLHNPKGNKIDKVTRRFERMVNTVCFLLSPIIAVFTLLFSLAGLIAILAAAAVGFVVEMATWGGLIKGDVVDVNAADANNNYAFISQALTENQASPPLVISTPLPVTTQSSSNEETQTLSEVLIDSDSDDSVPSHTDEEHPSYCSIGIM